MASVFWASWATLIWPWKTPRARSVTTLRMISVEVGLGHGVVEHHGHVGMRVAGQQVDAAQREVRALARRRDMDLLAHQLAAGVHDEQRQLRVLAELGVELAEMGRRRPAGPAR